MRDSIDSTDSAFDGLRRALASVLDGRASSDELRNAVRLVCVHAHSEDVPAEQLLVRFKEVWSTLPQVRGLPLGGQQNELMTRVIKLCIEEFYGYLPMRGDGGMASSLKPDGSDGQF